MKQKLVRITTVPISLDKLLTNQMKFMNSYYDVIAVSSDKDNLEQIANKQNVSFKAIDMTRKITPIKDIISLIRMIIFFIKLKPNIVHSHTPKAGIIGMIAARLTGVPNRLHTVAGLPLMETTGIKRNILNLVEKLTYACATKVYPNSKGLYDFILENNFTLPHKLSIIGQGSSNGIDTSFFNKDNFEPEIINNFKLKFGITTTDFVFIFVGRLVADKGINELIQAFDILSKTNNTCKLLLVGPLETELDPLKAQTLAIIESNKNIIFVGYQTDVRLYFAISNVLVFPSYREGFPNVVMQAGAMGLPSIVSNINGCNEIISNNENGIIIPVKNSDAILTAMESIFLDSNLYNQMVIKSREIIAQRYEQKYIWEELLNEYKKLEDNV